jgi:hypothetical protein
MPLHIFLGDEVLLYFIVQIEVVEIQIWFEFKLVCNLQKDLKIYKWFSIFVRRIGPNPDLGLAGLLSRTVHEWPSAWPSGPASLANAHPSQAAWSDPLSVNPTRWALNPARIHYHTR